MKGDERAQASVVFAQTPLEEPACLWTQLDSEGRRDGHQMKTEKSGSHPALSCLADPSGAFVFVFTKQLISASLGGSH